MATEYAQCPKCLDDGPHFLRLDGMLECDCGAEFPNPFEEE